jgi:hypothetical protein
MAHAPAPASMDVVHVNTVGTSQYRTYLPKIPVEWRRTPPTTQNGISGVKQAYQIHIARQSLDAAAARYLASTVRSRDTG